ncbi:helix-turn-helix transcriptional regulator [Solwaraspora sp. WMMD406]|uniref:helix-turn-helix domain-containing protein n=1 Tax=Solwaraspora sp. WMMD406 TaxID=3016095 RepID=UPI00241799E2|nr:helix-turn-helix transcriptional regulator [Solwaraspora sp. WMMD406]MDG4765114.1 helix-turn-helix transcriptional regulator [Solwaraspora sp. WMMD406]
MKTVTQKARYCRCGARLARDNPGNQCAACLSADRDRLAAAPEVSAEFWDEVVLREALQTRHMGRVIRAWRTHPQHGRQPVPQERVAAWVGISQAQLSRIENGPPIAHLDRLIQWARVLRVPANRLWFALPETAPGQQEEESTVKRREFLASAGMTVVGGLLPQQPPSAGLATADEPAEWLAWLLWQRQTRELEASLVPPRLASHLKTHPQVISGPEGSYRFTDPAMIDGLVAQRIFGGVQAGDSHLLSTAQTSHATDMRLSALTGEDEAARRGLASWMSWGATPVLRVNAAGVLAKVGVPDLGDSVVSALRIDRAARHLYLTAVAARVLDATWDHAEHVVAGTDGHPSSLSDRLGDERVPWAAERLAAEIANPRDAAARWCCAIMLSSLAQQDLHVIHAALARAIQDEPCRENLRAYAAVLAGNSPIV